MKFYYLHGFKLRWFTRWEANAGAAAWKDHLGGPDRVRCPNDHWYSVRGAGWGFCWRCFFLSWPKAPPTEVGLEAND